MSELNTLVTVKLDKIRHLKLGLRGMLKFEKQTGKNLLHGLDLKDFSLEDSAALIWACLVHEDKELTFDDVLGMVDFNNLVPVMDAVTKCLAQDMPSSKKSATKSSAKTARPG